MGCHACVLSRKEESVQARTWQEGWARQACPNCGKGFNLGQCIVVQDENIVYHCECIEEPKQSFEERVVT